MATGAPQRIVTAVAQLQIQPTDHLLEIGCGNGTAAALVCEQLEQGQLVAIDRSEKQIALASTKLRVHLDAGRARLEVTALEAVTLGNAQFDKIYASNVNCFWLRAAEPMAAVKRLLKPNGTFLLFYQQLSTAQTRDIASRLRDNLSQAGFVIQQATTTGEVYCLTSRLAAYPTG